MQIQNITEKQRQDFNSVATHPLQSYEWGEFRQKTGIKVIRKAFVENKKIVRSFQMTIHPIPKLTWNIGYIPKGFLPTREFIEELYRIGKENKCIFIQIEPNCTVQEGKQQFESEMPSFTKAMAGKQNTPARNATHSVAGGIYKILPSHRPLFTNYTFQLDLTPDEETLLKNMHQKTRYNIKVAQKHDVKIVADNSDEAFEEYWRLTEETTRRQGFFAHTKRYHQLMWQTLKSQESKVKSQNFNELQAHLFLAKYIPEDQPKGNTITLAAWVLFTFHDTLYYPYGSSSSEFRNVMASNLMMWEAIRFGKKMGLKTFDMWGSLGENPDTADPWYGFHRLKQGYSPKLIEFVGSYDLIINPYLYELYKTADKLRWLLLKKK